MVIRKRCLLWDYTNTRDRPDAINQLDFSGPFCSVHNWNAWTPPELAGRLPFRPMARTSAQLTGPEWGWIAGAGAAVVHFLNEPERQGDLPPERAAALWRERMLAGLRWPSGGRTKLVGPSVASDDAGRVWLRAFMGHLRRDQGEWPDFLGAHYYGTDAGAARQYLEGLRGEFGLDVVVSEVACVAREPARVARFTADLANWMDATPWIVEYGFFGCMAGLADDFVSPAAQLMDPQGAFTPLMRRLMTEQPMK